MATPQHGVWGIDVGQCALKALRVEIADGQVKATHFDFVEHPKILSQPDADPDQLTREALEKFLSRNTIKGDTVVMSVPGQSGLARFVKLPPVEEKKINDIVRFEAKQQIPFPLEEVVWDYQKIGSGMVTDGFALETEIGLFAMKRDMVNRFLQHFQDVNVEVNLVQMAPLALCNYLAYDLLKKGGTPPAEGEGEGEKSGRQECVVALDIGADNSNLVITDGDRVIWQRPVPLGGNHFTRALTKDMKLTFAKAEHLKRNAAKSPDLKKILTALKPVLNDFVGEVQRSLGFFTSTHRNAEVQYLVGLGSAFKLPGLQKYLSEKLSMEIRKPQKFERLTGDDVITKPNFVENVLSFAVTYGLALQGLKLARLQTNLLPREIRVARMVRAKKPWVVAGAASLLFGCATMALGYGCQKNTYGSPIITSALENGQKVTAAVDKKKGECATVESKIDQDSKAVKDIVAGQDEVLNWIRFNNYVNDCLPRPDCKNLEGTVQTKYRSGQENNRTFSGERAYEKYQLRQAGKLPSDDTQELDSLIQINLENLNAMYTEDLDGFFKRLKDGANSAQWGTLSKDEQDKPPTGKGWVVELRGFTYHKHNRQFVLDTVVRNLSVKSKKAEKPAESSTAVPPQSAASSQPEPLDPVANNVSHVILYQFTFVENPTPGVFELINTSYLAHLATGAAISGQGGGPGGPLGAAGGPMGMGGGDDKGGTGGIGGAGPKGPPWAPLGGIGLTTSGGSPMGGITGGTGGTSIGIPPRGTGTATGTGGSPMGTTGVGEKPSNKPPLFKRTEFVIVFVWKEPVDGEGKPPEVAPPIVPTGQPPTGLDPMKPDEKDKAADDKGKPDDKGKAADDKGKPDDKGKAADDKGKPDDKGKAADDKGKPDDKGKAADDKGKPDDKGKAADDKGKADKAKADAKSNGPS